MGAITSLSWRQYCSRSASASILNSDDRLAGLLPLVTELSYRINDKFGVTIPIAVLFNDLSVLECSQFVEQVIAIRQLRQQQKMALTTTHAMKRIVVH